MNIYKKVIPILVIHINKLSKIPNSPNKYSYILKLKKLLYNQMGRKINLIHNTNYQSINNFKKNEKSYIMNKNLKIKQHIMILQKTKNILKKLIEKHKSSNNSISTSENVQYNNLKKIISTHSNTVIKHMKNNIIKNKEMIKETTIKKSSSKKSTSKKPTSKKLISKKSISKKSTSKKSTSKKPTSKKTTSKKSTSKKSTSKKS
jgi:hypothetical protein